MDQAQQRKLIGLAKKFLLPRIRQWLKQKFASGGAASSGGQQHHQQQQQSYSQASQGHQYGQNQGGQYNQNQNYQQPQQSYQQQPAQNYGQSGGYYGSSPPVQHQPQQYQNQNSQYGAPSHAYKPPVHTNSDMQNAQDPHYVQLRNQAIQEGNLMHQAFESASRAHDSGDGAGAKQYSNQGHEHQRRKDQLNSEAADWIFNANNRSQPNGTIDLHGLYVQEAIERTESVVKEGQAAGLQQLRIITGKGIHSQQHVAKIKPAIEQLMVKYNLEAHLEPGNSGVLVVDLSGRGGGGRGSRDLGWVDQADRDSAEGECTIM